MSNAISDSMEQWFTSPNFTPGRTRPIDLIIIHSTRGGATIGVEAQATVNWFLSPNSQASAHLIITQRGQFLHMVGDENTAWGAGELNPRALQVELEQPTNDVPFSEVQMLRLAEAIAWWCSQHDIPMDRDHILSHDQTSQGLLQGKSDVGKMFDWDLFWRLLAPPEPDWQSRALAAEAKLEQIRLICA